MNTTKKYIYNERGVCINPDVIEICHKKRAYAVVEIAERDGVFDYGFHYDAFWTGHTKPCLIRNSALTSRDAILKALDLMIEGISLNWCREPGVKESLNTIHKACEDYKKGMLQLALFFEQH